MRSRYDAADAGRLVAGLAPACAEDLALRVYTSRLLGGDPALVLHGGGNTSVKSVAREADGSEIAVLHVKGSGGDLATITPTGFATCRLAPLRALCGLDALSDEAMVRALRSQMLDPGGPTPSVEALLHAFLPAKFVDHTHADAVLALLDQPDAEAIAAEVWGADLAVAPYVMPGFALARRVVALGADAPRFTGLVLAKHGIFTWGATAEESYERMIAAVSAAETWRDARLHTLGRRPRVAAPGAETPGSAPASAVRSRRDAQRRLSPMLRGAFSRRGGGRWIGEWRDDAPLLAFLERPDAPSLVERGTVTPDHVIRTRPRPLWLAGLPDDDAALRDAIERTLEDYAGWYRDYFARHAPRAASPLRALDPLPRVILVPGLGALAVGRSLAEARVVGDVVSRAVTVMGDAEDLGRYEPVSEGELFDVEYWSLEQAKLANAAASGPLAGAIVLVTGAARGIGRATAKEFLALGAHVLLTDRDVVALDATHVELAARFGTRVAAHPCDVTDDAAVTATLAHAIERLGGVDILVSNAGIAPSGLLHTAAGAVALEASLAVNLLGHQRVARAAVGVMLRQGAGGCLLFNGSKSAVNPGREFGPYAVAKAGLLALMRQYAVDLGRDGIRSNAVNADRIRTDLFGDGVLEARAAARGVRPDAYFRDNLLARETEARDVARAFTYLAQADATTGCVITVDGGNAAAFLR